MQKLKQAKTLEQRGAAKHTASAGCGLGDFDFNAMEEEEEEEAYSIR